MSLPVPPTPRDEPLLLVGGTGTLGRLVTGGLIAAGHRRLRLLTRRPDAVRAVLCDRAEIVVGDARDPDRLEKALAQAQRLFLLTPIAADLADTQIAVIDAAVAAGVRRIVKISGSDWTITPPGASRAGALHARVEAHLAAAPVESVALRPTAWMQVSLGLILARLARGEPVPRPAAAPVAYIDARDIAAVAAELLLADTLPPGPLVLTGPQALPGAEIEALLPAGASFAAAAGAKSPHDPFHDAAVAEFRALIAAGAAALVTDTVPRLLGRPARTVAAFVSEKMPLT